MVKPVSLSFLKTDRIAGTFGYTHTALGADVVVNDGYIVIQ